MTIRGYINRRAMLIRYAGLLWTITVLLAVVVAPERYANVDVGHVVGYFVPILALYALAFATRCPRCRFNLAEMTWNIANPFSSEAPTKCSNCGVSLDEQMESPTNRR
jgi:hypothetical protein